MNKFVDLYDDDLKENFEIEIKVKCKKCGSGDVLVEFVDEYGDCETYLGRKLQVHCNNCETFFIE